MPDVRTLVVSKHGTLRAGVLAALLLVIPIAVLGLASIGGWSAVAAIAAILAATMILLIRYGDGTAPARAAIRRSGR